MNKIELIIWDWNGTLLNDVEICVESMNELLTEYNYDNITLEKYQNIFSFPVKNYYKKAGFDFKKHPFEVVGLEYIDLYNKKIEKCRLQKNAEKILQVIQSKKIKQIIISAREHNALKDDIKYYKIDKYFDEVMGISNNLGGGKNDLFDKYLSKIDIDNQNILLVGDTTHDYDIAKQFGLNFIRFSKGHQNKSHFTDNEILSIDDLMEVNSLISN